MCYWVMPVNGSVIAETTVQHVTREDMSNPEIAKQIETFNEALDDRMDDTNFHLEGIPDLEYCEDDFDLPQWDSAYGDFTPGDAEYGDVKQEGLADADDLGPEVYDRYIGAQIILDDNANNGGNIATVKRRTTDLSGSAIGMAHRNPMLDTREYEIELEDGTVDKMLANKIAENI